MSKRICAKVGVYQKDGQEKGEYVKIGVMLNNQNGDYMLLDPSVSLAGVLAKQNALALSQGKQARDMVAVSIFDDNNQQQQSNNQDGYQQQQQGYNQAPQQQGNYQQQPQQQNYNQAPQQGGYQQQGKQ